ncbi:hypothetical protein EDC01DRAFT_753343 [Geopyxis carbonaria]|nr:hypothetical protein EDC01DRAFT_753343 [Geopyxis carbonaria]
MAPPPTGLAPNPPAARSPAAAQIAQLTARATAVTVPLKTVIDLPYGRNAMALVVHAPHLLPYRFELPMELRYEEAYFEIECASSLPTKMPYTLQHNPAQKSWLLKVMPNIAISLVQLTHSIHSSSLAGHERRWILRPGGSLGITFLQDGERICLESTFRAVQQGRLDQDPEWEEVGGEVIAETNGEATKPKTEAKKDEWWARRPAKAAKPTALNAKGKGKAADSEDEDSDADWEARDAEHARAYLMKHGRSGSEKDAALHDHLNQRQLAENIKREYLMRCGGPPPGNKKGVDKKKPGKK